MAKSAQSSQLPPPGNVLEGGAIDMDHLARQTMGDATLADQILQLFLQQCEACVAQIDSEPSAEEILEIAHKFTGCARAVGAFELAQSADLLEENPDSSVALSRIKLQCLQMCEFLSAAK